MTQYVGCDHARGLLDGLVDGELSMAEQLAVESHLRWCRTCALRVEDMRLIGSSLRMGSASAMPRREDADEFIAAMNDGVLMRVRTEREQSFGVRVSELFVDRRLLWPALGASVAVALCVGVVTAVLHASTAWNSDSLAALIPTLATPGSEQNPLRPVNLRDPLRDESRGTSIPRLYADDAKRAGGTLEDIPEEDVVYTIRTVVSRDGRISNFEVLPSEGEYAGNQSAAEHAGHTRAVLNAVQQSRFSPAQNPLGHAVAVDMVWVIAKTTAVVGPAATFAAPALDKPRPKDTPKPADAAPDPAADPGKRSAAERRLTTA
jgi:hypothetical protein